MKSLTERINEVEKQIAEERAAMDKILTDNGVKYREELGEAVGATWDSIHRTVRDLDGYLLRVSSVLHSAEQYMVANCG